MTNVSIQTNTEATGRTVVDSKGTLFTCYRKSSPSEALVMAYSTDGGTTWTEVLTTKPAGLSSTSIAIDSADVIHVAYDYDSYILGYNTFSGLAWGTPEVVFDGTSDTDSIDSDHVKIAVDASDTPHIAWSQDEPTTPDSNAYHTSRVSGVWTARTSIMGTSSTRSYFVHDMVIDSNGHIYVFAYTTVENDLVYSKYTGSWSGPNALDTSVTSTAADFEMAAIVDSSDNVYVVYINSDNTAHYIKYTKATDTWGVDVAITLTPATGVTFISLGILANDTIYLLISDTLEDVYYLTYTGSWSVATLVVSSTTFTAPFVYTPIYPIFEGVSSHIPTAGFHFTFDTEPNDELRYFASADLDLQTPLSKNYSRKAGASLPTDDSPLATLFSAAEYGGVLSDDNNYVSQTATDQYSITQFKNRSANDTDEIHVSWRGKSSLAPSTSPVVLQIYNRSADAWETLTSDSATPANTEFTLTSSKTTNLNQYYDANNWVSFRIYQLAQ